jgi:hypothetical protein
MNVFNDLSVGFPASLRIMIAVHQWSRIDALPHVGMQYVPSHAFIKLVVSQRPDGHTCMKNKVLSVNNSLVALHSVTSSMAC